MSHITIIGTEGDLGDENPHHRSAGVEFSGSPRWSCTIPDAVGERAHLETFPGAAKIGLRWTPLSAHLSIGRAGARRSGSRARK
jgi:hypothetical protein